MDAEVLEMLRRQSGISVTAEGTFLYRDAPVENPRVQDLFHRGLGVREDGETVLRVGELWCYVDCEGVARFVTSVGVRDGGLSCRLRSGERLLLAEPLLVAGPDERFYLWPEPDGPPAVLTRPAHQQLAGLLDAEEGGELVLPLGGRLRAVPASPRAPGPADPYEAIAAEARATRGPR